ncbi:acyl-CoA dehydrogenase family protein [Actinokineospora pegani]|uniref:acyl-CoA dehydrogenase family protein n=1 Tax=Actinokineospora pegani TaxID=2654637 RepID=UPI001F28CC6F|nr:acyl-CoA dehydrogenase family protein [Actinokineospora pegani]
MDSFAAEGFFGALVPDAHGGQGYDAVSFGLLNEALGAACSSVRSMLTVHSMVAHAVTRWGSVAVRERWLPALASGKRVGAFALTEEGSGSDAGNLDTRAERVEGGYLLTGEKKWITYGQRADVFLVFARSEGEAAAFLVERDAPGLEVVPINGVLGTRASMLAELRLTACRVPDSALIAACPQWRRAHWTSAATAWRGAVWAFSPLRCD